MRWLHFLQPLLYSAATVLALPAGDYLNDHHITLTHPTTDNTSDKPFHLEKLFEDVESDQATETDNNRKGIFFLDEPSEDVENEQAQETDDDSEEPFILDKLPKDLQNGKATDDSEEVPTPFRSIVLGISGASCSGKTTLSNCLRQVLPNCVMIQLDDYFKPAAQIPVDAATGLANWDIPEALRYEDLLKDLKKERTVPISKLATKPSEAALRNAHHGEASESLLQLLLDDWNAKSDEAKQRNPDQSFLPLKIILLDGFLLYQNAEISAECDLRLFLWANRATLKHRRNSRKGYVTAEADCWVEAPNYWDDLAWPSHEANHKHICDYTPSDQSDVISKTVLDPATALEYHVVQSENPWSREKVAEEVMSRIARAIYPEDKDTPSIL